MYPEGSISQQLLERCMEAAIYRGTDVSAPYTPWVPVDLMQTLLVDVHEAVGCSWAMAIFFACIGIRIVTLPVGIASIRSSREKALIQPKFTELTEKQTKYSQEKNQEQSSKVTKEIQAFTQKHGKFWMLKGVSNFVCFQVPLYVTAFASMRGFANHPDLFRSFAMESPLWLDSLALPDPYGLFPLLTGAIMLTNVELFGSIDTEMAAMEGALGESKSSPNVAGQGTFNKYKKWIIRGTTVAFIPMTWNFPAGVFIFMSTNMIASALQNRLLKLPVLERLLELPPTLERSKEIAKMAGVRGPSGLVPLGQSLPTKPAWLLGKVNQPSRVQKGDQKEMLAPSFIAAASAANPAIALAQVESTTPSPRTLEDLVVSRGFAVKRVRPL